jgi:hypothetical protein
MHGKLACHVIANRVISQGRGSISIRLLKHSLPWLGLESAELNFGRDPLPITTLASQFRSTVEVRRFRTALDALLEMGLAPAGICRVGQRPPLSQKPSLSESQPRTETGPLFHVTGRIDWLLLPKRERPRNADFTEIHPRKQQPISVRCKTSGNNDLEPRRAYDLSIQEIL